MAGLRASTLTGLGLARGRGAFSVTHAPRWLRLEALQLPAGVEAGQLVGLELEPGGFYRARLRLTGLASFASQSRLIAEFGKLGFVGVEAWDDPRGLPADWPALERAPARSGATWWLQGRYQGPARSLDAAALEDKGVQVLWAALVAPAAPPAPPPPPPPPATAPPANQRPKASAQDDLYALNVIDRVWPTLHGRPPSQTERLFTAALARGESYYGRGYGPGVHNWGSVHAGKPPCGPTSIPWTDHDAEGKAYPICMRRYASDEEGAADLIRLLTTKRPRTWAAVRAAATLDAIAVELRAERYFEASAANYAKMLRNNLAVILKSADLADPFGAPPGAPLPAGPPAAASSSAAPLLLLGGGLAALFFATRR